MKIIHKIKAILLRRRLIRQRAENIRNLRTGRRAAKAIKIELAREIRLSGLLKCPAVKQFDACALSERLGRGRTAKNATESRFSSILSNLRFERRAA